MYRICLNPVLLFVTEHPLCYVYTIVQCCSVFFFKGAPSTRSAKTADRVPVSHWYIKPNGLNRGLHLPIGFQVQLAYFVIHAKKNVSYFVLGAKISLRVNGVMNSQLHLAQNNDFKFGRLTKREVNLNTFEVVEKEVQILLHRENYFLG